MFDESARRRIAQGWTTTPLDQESYAAAHGISPRTLREWVRRHGSSDRPVARARAIIDDAIAKLQALRSALDAEEACRVGADVPGLEVVRPQPARHAEPVVKLRVLPPADPAPAPPPRQRGGFFSSMNDEP